MSSYQNAQQMAQMQQMAEGLQAMENQLKDLELQRQIFEQQLQGIEFTKDTIENLEKIEGENETIIPIGSETFLRTKMQKPEKLIVNIGAGYLVEQGVKECKELQEKRKESMVNLLKNIDSSIEELYAQLEKYRPIFQSMVQQMNLAQQASAGVPSKINPDDIG